MRNSGSRLALANALPAMSPVVTTNYFEYIGANDDKLLAEVYRVRYQVYCVERELLDGSAYLDFQESDEFDPYAVHVLARHRNGEVAGTARLVLHSERGFPCQAYCEFFEEFAYLRDSQSGGLATYSEVSRLAISKQFRRRASDSFYGGDPRIFGASDRRGQDKLAPPGPEIVVGILKYLYHETKRLGVTHWLIAIERGLGVFLKRLGLPFVAVGPEVDYCGPVRPYVAEVSHTESVLQRKNPRLLSFVRHGLPQVCQGAGRQGPVAPTRSLRIVGD
jgi:N-acyl amino acid synthase of PEP-CTERM/exosortase system